MSTNSEAVPSPDEINDDQALSMRGITKRFSGVVALDNVDFTLRKGEVHVIIGANGAGKSTLMKILSGAYTMDSGEIRLNGQSVNINDARHAQSLGISIIYQNFSQVLHLSVAENIYLGREKTRYGLIDFKRMRRDAEAALARIGLKVDVRTMLGRLGVAQRQMVEIAKALSFDAKVVLMDEPTSALTEKETETLFALIRSLKKRGISTIYISHRIEELKRIGDRVTVMRDGKNVATCQIAEIATSELIRLMIGRQIKTSPDSGLAQATRGTESLRVENLKKENTLHDVSFSLHSGEVLGLFGLMGAGCTEIARSIFGVDRFDGGSIFVNGREARIQSPADAMKYGLGFLTEDRQQSGLAVTMSVGHNITLPSMGDFKLVLDFLNLTKENAAIARSIAELEIKTPSARQQVQFLSGGNQQKVVFAKWLMARSTILLLDEPTQGIDVSAKGEVQRLIVKFARELGGSVLLITSELPELLGLSDRILVVRQGAIVAEIPAREADQEKVMSYAVGNNIRQSEVQ
jgi:ribose transport system ATP-binding protein